MLKKHFSLFNNKYLHIAASYFCWNWTKKSYWKQSFGMVVYVFLKKITCYS